MKNNNVYETPVVTKVEYDASDRITASSCSNPEPNFGPTDDCKE